MNKYLLILIILIIDLNCFIKSSDEINNLISPTNSDIHYVGRIDKTQSNEYYAFSWSGCQITINITRVKEINILLNSQKPNWFDIFIDGQFYKLFNLTGTSTSSSSSSTTTTTTSSSSSSDQPMIQLINISNGLDINKKYTITISKRTEAEFGEVRFFGFLVDSPNYLLSPYTPPTQRKFEFIGDSIATGYGDEGKAPCAFEESTENVDVSFASVITNELMGEMNMAAWSGKGVIKNYGSSTPTSTETLPDLYPYTLPLSDNSSFWNPKEFIPDVIVINLGANDYTDPPYPTQEQFESTFVSFIKSMLINYQPATPKLFFICGVMIGDPCTCLYTQNVSNLFNATYIEMDNIQDSSSDFGCYGHPTVKAHYHMASIAIPIIKQVMNW